MSEAIKTLCAVIRHRSEENTCAMQLMTAQCDIPLSPAFALLRQELDSMVKTVFLLSRDKLEREKYATELLGGQRWKMKTITGKERNVLDKDLVDLAQTLQGWTRSVYKFGCAFIHLSEFHNYFASNPFSNLSCTELEDIAAHLAQYHGYDPTKELSIDSIRMYIPMIFDKIHGNLECYIADLEAGRELDDDSWIFDS